jgi:hypothetical protein
MILTVHSTTKIVKLNGIDCRIWEGHTASGLAVHCFIARVALHEDLDASEFERELQECSAPSIEVEKAYDLRMRRWIGRWWPPFAMAACVFPLGYFGAWRKPLWWILETAIMGGYTAFYWLGMKRRDQIKRDIQEIQKGRPPRIPRLS